jgi:hypothetical protein
VNGVTARAAKIVSEELFVAVPGIEDALPVSFAVSITTVGPNVTVGVPEITQFAPVGVTTRPAGKAGAKTQLVSGPMPPVVRSVCA